MKKTKLISALCAVVLTFGAAAAPVGDMISDGYEITAAADENRYVFHDDDVCDIYAQLNSSNTLTITGISIYQPPIDLRIPEEINGVTVTAIGEGAFAGESNFWDVYIPDTVTGIGDRAFSGCKSLTDIRFGKNLKSIGNEAFKDCTDMMNNFDYDTSSDNGKSRIIGRYILPEGLESIGDSAFAGCRSIGDIILPRSLTYIGSNAFPQEQTDPDGGTICCYKGSYAEDHLKSLGAGYEYANDIAAGAVTLDYKEDIRRYYQYFYDNKAKEPEVILTDAAENLLVKGRDYDLYYEGDNKNPGSFSVCVEGKDGYFGKRELTVWILEAGDINRDLKVDTKDAMLAVRYAKKELMFDPYRVYSGDVNNDGKIDSKDAMRIISIAKKSV